MSYEELRTLYPSIDRVMERIQASIAAGLDPEAVLAWGLSQIGKIKNPRRGINSRATAKCDSPWKAELSVTVNADALLVLCELLEFNLTVGKSKQSVVGTAADILAGMDVRTALSDNDIAGGYALTVRFFHT